MRRRPGAASPTDRNGYANRNLYNYPFTNSHEFTHADSNRHPKPNSYPHHHAPTV